MEQVKIPSAVEIFGYFVGTFEEVVRPFLEEKEYDFACMAINDLYDRHQMVSRDINLKVGVSGGCYHNAVVELKSFCDAKDKDSDRAQLVLSMARRNIAELDLILSGNEEYESQRQRS